MEKMKRKIMAWMMVLTMLLSLAPELGVYASDVVPDDVTGETTETSEIVTEEVNGESAAEVTETTTEGILDATETTTEVIQEETEEVTEEATETKDGIPATYDLRNVNGNCYVNSPIKMGANQNIKTVFSVIGALESNMLMQGIPNPKLSEHALVWFSNFRQGDKLGNLNNDIVSSGTYINSIQKVTYLSRCICALLSGSGMVDNNVAPYENLDVNHVSLPDSLQFQGDYQLKEVQPVSMEKTFSSENSRDIIKQNIMKYGAGVCTMYYDYYSKIDISKIDKNGMATKPFNQSSSSTSLEEGNLQYLIIGWDDNYSRNNFSISNSPHLNGAWLLQICEKNTCQYLWVSYEDEDMINSSVAFLQVGERPDNLYQYDGTNDIGSWYAKNQNTTFVNKFEIKGGSNLEKIESVGFGIVGQSDYEIQLYKNSDEDNPLSGTPLLSTPQKGTMNGESTDRFQTIFLDEAPLVKKGDTVSVAITFSDNCTILGDGSDTMAEGQCYYIEGEEIGDLADSLFHFTPRIKMSTQNHSHNYTQQICDVNTLCSEATLFHPATYYYSCDCGCIGTETFEHGDVLPNKVQSITLSSKNIALLKGKTTTLKAKVIPATTKLPYNKNVMWYSKDTSIAKVSSKGVVTAVKKGSVILIAKAMDGSGVRAYCRVEVKQPVTKIKLNKYKLALYKGKTYTIKASALPSNANNRSVAWISSDKKVATVTSSGKIIAKGRGKAKIYAKAKDGSGVNAYCIVVVK